MGELARAVNEQEADLGALKFDPAQVREVWSLQDEGAISSTAAKEVLAELIRTGKAPATNRRAQGALPGLRHQRARGGGRRGARAQPAEVDRYKGGKKNLLGFFVGQAMKELKGKGNPGVLNALFKKKLG